MQSSSQNNGRTESENVPAWRSESESAEAESEKDAKKTHACSRNQVTQSKIRGRKLQSESTKSEGQSESVQVENAEAQCGKTTRFEPSNATATGSEEKFGLLVGSNLRTNKGQSENEAASESLQVENEEAQCENATSFEPSNATTTGIRRRV